MRPLKMAMRARVCALGLAVLLSAPAGAQQDTAAPGPTPLNERVVTVGVLDKVSQAVESFEARPGQTIRYKGLAIRVRSCQATPPWADRQFVGGFLQIDYRRSPSADPARVFSGWLYANTPSLNSFDHPAYDVWVSACQMSWPETGADTIVVN
ncbi:MAG: DUF2155 domain-containing protein [Pseudomonadota bacterium]